MRNFTDEQIKTLAEHLKGANSSVDIAVTTLFGKSEDDMTNADHAYMDTLIFHCMSCRCWCDISQVYEVQHRVHKTCEECCQE